MNQYAIRRWVFVSLLGGMFVLGFVSGSVSQRSAQAQVPGVGKGVLEQATGAGGAAGATTCGVAATMGAIGGAGGAGGAGAATAAAGMATRPTGGATERLSAGWPVCIGRFMSSVT